METIKLAKARAQISKLVQEIEVKGPILLERRGQPVAVLLPLKEYDRLKRTQRIDFGEYNLGKIKGKMRREEIYGGYRRFGSA
jgi:prevent-host-death family protein